MIDNKKCVGQKTNMAVKGSTNAKITNTCYTCYDELSARQSIYCINYGCQSVICVDCINMMIQVCCENINMMPACECECEYLASQLQPVLTAENIEGYTRLCAQWQRSRKGKNDHRALMQALQAAVRSDIKESLPPAIAHLMVISGMDLTVAKLKRKRYPEQQTSLVRQYRLCASYICKGRMFPTVHDGFDVLRCSECALLICVACDSVRATGAHACKAEDVETVKTLNEITKCPKCGVAATKGEGCVFVTCPFCNINFNSKTGEKTLYGGHNPVKHLNLTLHTALAELDPSPEAKEVLNEIQRLMPQKATSTLPLRCYEQHYRRKLWYQCVNRCYEHRAAGTLTLEILVGICRYVSTLV